MHIRCLSLAVLLLVTISAPGRAEPDTTAEARAHFSLAEAHFSLGEFEQALEEYRKAYLLRPMPPLLFNMAQCHRHLGQLDRAAFLLRRFLDSNPAALQRQQATEVLRLVTDARQRPRGNAATPPPSAAAPATPPAGLAPDSASPMRPPVARTPQRPLEPSAARSRRARADLTPTAHASSAGPAVATQPFYRRWWFWAVVGGTVAAAATTAGILASGGNDVPRGTLADIDYRR